MHPCRTLSISLALLSVTTALTAPASAADSIPAPITVQTGDHADFSRLALVNAQGAPAVDVGSCGGRVAFSQAVPWPLEALNGTYSRRLTGFQTAEDGRSLTMDWPCGARVTVRRERRITFIDVTDPPRPARKPGAPVPASEGILLAEAPGASVFPVIAPPAPEAAPAPVVAAQAAPVSLAERLNPVASAHAQPIVQAPQPVAPQPVAKAPPPAPPPKPEPARTVAAVPPSAMPPSVMPPVAAPAVQTDPPIRAFDLDAWAGDDYPARKQLLEQRIAESQGRARVDALLAMARFTLARALPEEGRAALDAAESLTPGPDQRYELRLLRDALRALDGTADPDDSQFVRAQPTPAAADHHVWRSATLAPSRWTAAKSSLPIALKRLLSYPVDLRGRLLTLLAESAGEAADGASLNLIVLEMITLDGIGSTDGRLDFFRGRLAELHNETAEALAHYKRAAALPNLYGHRAQVRSIELRLASGALDDPGAIAELESLRYAWRGGDVETDALAALGAAYTRAGRIDAALDIFGLLGRRFGATARGRAALTTGRGLLDAVIGHLETTPGSALDALSLQVRYGRTVMLTDDDAGTQQRRLARLLARGGFTLEAARLLHGLAETARGAQRADIGLELARVLLDAGRGAEALAVLDHTAGPAPDAQAAAPEIARRRALLRAEAFAAEGEAMRAFDALRGLTGPEAARIRADSLFRAGEWPAARAAYAELLGGQDAPLPDDIAFHALAAFRAGDDAAVAAAAERHGKALAGTRWAGLLDALAVPPDPAGKPLSSATVGGQLAAADALAGVLRRWKTP
ncbi:hypothetical protein ABAZ39_32555 (plasmid) [Azospirillum argentinense]|uniref:Tetratricopeptide repeat protein n=1 Tax=Azospirillum argentinense TaxID=2970906 RepID=A0A060DUX2_9PROT|nr:hypothetical protein [Azospirillum argentinense]AIB16572.1 hypothetical protein ABAZ39_32555 [Azospirillum argentinense]